MSGEKFRLRRASVNQDIPISEYPGIGEVYVDVDVGAFGLTCGEQNPRWYPGINSDGNLELLEGQEIVSSENPNTKISFTNGYFIVTVDGKEVFTVSKDANAIVDSLTLSDSLKFDQLKTVNFPDTPGFSFENGVFTISCPLQILGSLNLSLSEFAQGIIPAGASPGDVFSAGDFPGDPYKWSSPTVLVNKITKLAPLLYRTAARNTRSLDMTFGPYPVHFGMNYDRRGAFNDDLVAFLNTFGGHFSRSTVGWCYDATGKLTQVDVNQPRLDYDPYTGRFLGILIEDSSQNLHSNSNNMNGYTSTNMSAIATNSPNWQTLGLRNPSALSEIGSGEHSMQRAFNNRALNAPLSQSFHVELPSESATVRLLLTCSANGSTFGAKFNLDINGGSSVANFLTGNGVLYSTRVIRLSRTIYRIGISGVLDPSSSNLYTVSSKIQGLDSGNNTSYSSSASSIAYVGEIQLETNKRVTSLMPTNTNTVSRDSDDLSLNFEDTFNFTALKNFLGVKFISNNYIEGDPIYTLFNSSYRATLEAGPNNSIRIVKGTTDNLVTSTIGTIDNDFTTYEFDCTGQPLNSVLNIGASADSSKHFNGWVNLIYLYR